ncbi:hypothetical protein L3Q67_45415 (plasmid) [Saccharothrix sp. AJ9571]|nr:hypothetical protein L3Q67_45415 [Saccharothrix sp. AJ9571]
MEDIITSTQHVPSEKAVQALREQLNQDTQILASLDPNSDAHERLSARIERQTIQLIDFEEQRERQREQQRRALQAALAEQRRREDEVAGLVGPLIFAVIGGIIIYVGWGSWWLLLGLVLAVLGVLGLFVKDA